MVHQLNLGSPLGPRWVLDLDSWFAALGSPLGTLLGTSLGSLLGSPPGALLSWFSSWLDSPLGSSLGLPIKPWSPLVSPRGPPWSLVPCLVLIIRSLLHLGF